MLEFFGRLFELSGGTLKVELHDVVAGDEHAVALLTISAERAGRQLEDNTVLTSHIRDGKITEIWSHDTDLCRRRVLVVKARPTRRSVARPRMTIYGWVDVEPWLTGARTGRGRMLSRGRVHR